MIELILISFKIFSSKVFSSERALYAQGSFTFFVDRDPFPNNKIPVQPWRCTSEKTYHEMPEQFVDAINKWSYNILAQFEKESKEYNEKKAQHERSQYEEEEQRLQMYR